MIHLILKAVFILTTIPSVQSSDDGSNYLCVYECGDGIQTNKTYPNWCNPLNVLCTDYTLNPSNESEECPLYGTQIFSSETKCASFQNKESNSLYCLYKCSDDDFPNECLPKGQVCASPIDPKTGCSLYHEPVLFNGVQECEEFRNNGWSIEDCISCCSLAERVSQRWTEIVDDGCGVVYNSIIFGVSIGIGVAATPAAAVAFDVFMIGIDGVTAVFSNKYDGLGDMLCDAVGDASSELIALEKTREVCGDIMDGCSGCEIQSSSGTDISDITCDEAVDKTNSEECQCFAQNSLVITYPSFERKGIDALKVGDKVLTYDEVYNEFVFDEVIVITHKEDEYEVDMLSLIFNNGENNITLTPNHLLYINGNIVPAFSAKIGDYLSLYNNERVRIEDIVRTKQYPLNVWTHNGNIVVNEVSATSFDENFYGESSIFNIYTHKVMQYGYRYQWFKALIGFIAPHWNNVNKSPLISMVSFLSK